MRGDGLRGWGVLLGVCCVILFNYLFKQILALQRPEESGLTDFSFPSGHASAAAAFFTLCAVWLLHNRDHRSRHLGYLCTIPLMLAVAVSRPMLGVHWPLDVVAGIAEALIVTAVYRIWLYHRPAPVQIPLGWIAVLLGVTAFYLLFSLEPAAGRYSGG
jgi:undecaprenyl-diphosphatase